MSWCPNVNIIETGKVAHFNDLTVNAPGSGESLSAVLRNLMGLIALVLLICGIAFAGWGPVMITWFGVGHIPKPLEGDPFWPFWVGSAFARLFGASLVVLGLVVWSTRDIPDLTTQKIIGRALLLGSCFALLISLIQQIAIWNTPAGWGIVGIFITLAVLFAMQFTMKLKT